LLKNATTVISGRGGERVRQRVIACLLVFAVIAVLLPQTAYGASLLKYGSRGTEVKNLQQQLIKLGYLKGKADGIFGSQTRAAVIKFQKDYKLKQDGIVGPETRSKNVCSYVGFAKRVRSSIQQSTI